MADDKIDQLHMRRTPADNEAISHLKALTRITLLPNLTRLTWQVTIRILTEPNLLSLIQYIQDLRSRYGLPFASVDPDS